MLRNTKQSTIDRPTRIAPLDPPFDPDIDRLLTGMMPAGVPPIGLFRTFARNPAMTEAMVPWGTYELSRRFSLSMRQREMVIDRTAARCGCEYEWSVHVAFFADRVGFTADQLASLTHGDSSDPCWDAEDERVLLDVVDALHDHAELDDALWLRTRAAFGDEQILDLLLLSGWYHAISYVANGLGVPLEPGAPRFADHLPAASG